METFATDFMKLPGFHDKIFIFRQPALNETDTLRVENTLKRWKYIMLKRDEPSFNKNFWILILHVL